MKVKASVALGCAVVALFVTVGVILSSRSTAESAGPTTPTAVAQIPTTIPAGGVSIDPVASIVLSPADDVTTASLPISAAAAIAATPALMATGKPVESRAVLAYATIGASIPTGSAVNEKADTVQNQLVWAVTLTYPQPVNSTAGGKPTETPAPVPPEAMKSHFNALIDAQTGQLIWGFFTD